MKQGRQGYLGLGIETTPGTAVPATTHIPWMTNTIKAKHTPIEDIAARGSRVMDFSSTSGKKWSEGDVEVNVDSLQIGYLLKLATGTEATSTPTSGVTDHLFYTTVSGNMPLTATLYNYQGVDVQQFPSMAVDKLEFDVKDALMTAKASFKGFFPTSGSDTNATVSGTLLSYASYSMQFGSSLVNAAAASTTAVTDLQVIINNNADTIFESGQGPTTRVFWKQLQVTGSYTRYFESQTDRDNYYNLNKQSVIVTASGIGLPGNLYEKLVISLAKCAYTDQEITTGIEDFFAIKTTFTAEMDASQGKQYDILLRNYRGTAYS